MTLNEKVSYIKGLADGLDFDKTTKEGKLIAALIDLVGDLAQAQDETDDDLSELSDYVEELDSDLADVEDVVYGDEDEDDEDDADEDEDDDWDCANCESPCDDDYFEVTCPSCGETVCFDQSVDPADLRCPACGEKFECVMEEDDYKKLSEEDIDDLLSWLKTKY